MANPRAVVDFEGIGVRRETYIGDGTVGVYSATANGGSVHVGKAVQMVGQSTVGLTVDGSEVVGRLERVHPDGMCVVQTVGGCSLPGGDSATLTAGAKIVGALLPSSGGGGGIRAAGSPGGAYAESAADDSAVSRGRILDSTVTTAVKVMLD